MLFGRKWKWFELASHFVYAVERMADSSRDIARALTKIARNWPPRDRRAVRWHVSTPRDE